MDLVWWLLVNIGTCGEGTLQKVRDDNSYCHPYGNVLRMTACPVGVSTQYAVLFFVNVQNMQN